jgi:hypothetical protein
MSTYDLGLTHGRTFLDTASTSDQRVRLATARVYNALPSSAAKRDFMKGFVEAARTPGVASPLRW